MICPKCSQSTDDLFECGESLILCPPCASDLEETTGPLTFTKLSLSYSPSLESEVSAVNEVASSYAHEINTAYDSVVSLLQRQRRTLISLIERTRLTNIDILLRLHTATHAPQVDEPALGLIGIREKSEERREETGDELMYVSGNRGVRFDVDREAFGSEVRLDVKELPRCGSYLTWESNLLYTGGKSSNLCYLFQLSVGSLLHKSAMAAPRTGHTLVKHRQTVFIFGGQHNDLSTSLCEAFNLRTRSVTEVGHTKHARFNMAAVLHRDKVYLAGFAARGVGIKNEIEVFDPVTLTFSVVWQPSLNVNCSMVGFEFNDRVLFLKPTEVIHFSPGMEIRTTKVSPIIRKGTLKSQTRPIIYGQSVYFLTLLEDVPTVFAFDLHRFEAHKVATLRS